MTNNEYIQILDNLFNKLILVEGSIINFSLTIKKPKENPITKNPIIQTGWYNPVFEGLSVTTKKGLGNEILDMLFDVPVLTIDQQDEYQNYPYQVQQRHITISAIAEIIAEQGSVTIIKTEDIKFIYENLYGYYLHIENLKGRPNISLPPQQDINSFNNLRKILEPIYQILTNGNSSNPSFNNLRNYVQVNRPNINYERLEINGKELIAAFASKIPKGIK